MKIRQAFLGSAAMLTLTLSTSAAWAAELPKPCGPDARYRCVAYAPNKIFQLPLVPGATTTIQLPEGEVAFFIGTSDNNIITGKAATERLTVSQSVTADQNLQISVPGGTDTPTQFVTVKALRHLEPQPFVVIGIWQNPVTNKPEYRHHSFELSTIPGGPQGEDAIFSVTFSDPVAQRIVRDAKRKEEQAKIEAQTVANRLSQIQQSVLARNIAYEGQGTEADRVALAPSAPAGFDAMWDDGQRTFLRYPGNRSAPIAYQVRPDGAEAVIGQSTVTDSETKGQILIIHSVVPMLRLRDGDSVLCITNGAYDPIGRRTGTGTVDPGVVRDVRSAQ